MIPAGGGAIGRLFAALRRIAYPGRAGRRSRANGHLELSCADYRTLFENSREATLIIGADGVIAYANPAACDLFRYAPGQLAGVNSYYLIHPNYRDRFLGVSETLDRGRIFSQTARCLTKGGQVIEVEVRGSAVRLNNEAYFLATIREAMAGGQTEAALAATERRFRDLAELTADRFWETDMNQRFTYASGPVREDSDDGIDSVDLIGKTRREVHRSIGADLSVVDKIEEHMSRGEVFQDLTFSFVHPVKGEIWMKLSGRPILNAAGLPAGYRGVGRDCTQEVRQQRAIEESEQKLNAILNNAPTGVCLKNADGTYDLVNDRICEIFGRSREEILGKPATAILPKRVAHSFQSKDEIVFSTGRTLSFERRFGLPSGRRADFDIIKFPVRGDDGEIAQVGTIVREITSQKAAERLYRQASKMEAISDLIGGVAHDFNNLLAVVMGDGEAIMEDKEANPRQMELAEEIVEAAERGADLTSRLLTFSRRQSLAPEVQNLNELIREMLPLLRHSLGEHIEIELALAEDLSCAKVDASQLENCLVNLAGNARDAMPKGGRVLVETRNHRAGDETGCAGLAAGDYVCVSVRDDGCGMSETVAGRAFDPFFTTKDVGTGSGLGLSMVYGFAKQTGGTAEIDSVEGEGTVVRLYVPAEPAHSGAGADDRQAQRLSRSERAAIAE